MQLEQALPELARVASEQSTDVSDGSALAFAALVVAVCAAVISGVAMWRSHFARGKLIWAPGRASFSITGFRKEGATADDPGWFVPDLAIPMTIANSGAQAVIVRGLRLKVEYPELPIPGAHEIWELNCELDTTTELQSGTWRTALDAAQGNGTPFIVLPKSSIDRRFLFACRWERPVVQRMVFTLEVWTSRKPKWRTVETWKFGITGAGWVNYAIDGGRMGVVAAGQIAALFRRQTNPENLHDYTGPTKPLPAMKRQRPASIIVTRESGSIEHDG